MFTHPKIRALLAVVATMLLSPTATAAEFSGIRDNGAFFSEPAKAEAGRNIAEIGRRFKKDLVVETFGAVPDDIKQGVDLRDRAAVKSMFEQWTVKQARQQNVNGIYILLSKDPAHLQVVVGNETQRTVFTLGDRDALVGTMLAKLRGKQNDAALLAGVNFVGSAMKNHALARSRGPVPTKVEAPDEKPNPWGWVIAAVLGAGAAWLVVRVIRSIFSGGGAAGSAATPGAGGGGFFSSLLGGMFGAAAGMWLYNQFSGHHGSNSEQGGGDDSESRRRDSDYSGSGDTFSDDSGGSDIGGGDSGGGDSGGGDF